MIMSHPCALKNGHASRGPPAMSDMRTASAMSNATELAEALRMAQLGEASLKPEGHQLKPEFQRRISCIAEQEASSVRAALMLSDMVSSEVLYMPAAWMQH